MTFAEVAEGIRAALAAYTQALDDGRTEDVVATFCPDGVCEIPGLGTHQGHEALRAAYSPMGAEAAPAPPGPQHPVTEWSDDEAQAISDVLFLLLGRSGWSVQLVGRYHDTLHHPDGVWRFHRRSATFITEPPPPGDGG